MVHYRRGLAAAGVSLFLFAACNKTERPVLWQHPEANFLSATNTSMASGRNAAITALWRTSSTIINTSDFKTMKSWLATHQLQYLTITTYPENQRPFFPGTSMMVLESSQGYQSELLGVRSQDELDLIAGMVHTHADGGLACGRMAIINTEPLNVVQLDLDNILVLAPVHEDFAKLPGVSDAMALVEHTRIETDIGTLEGLGTRHHNSAGANEASDAVRDMWNKSAGSLVFATEQISHAGDFATPQKSVVLRIEGTKRPEEVVVVGSHLDSILNGSFGSDPESNAPGADDDASGVATISEVLRVLASMGWTFERSIEFHAYAAEEVGLRGSGDLADRYAAQGVRVASMVQLDMNSWSADPSDETIYLVTTDTFPNIRRHLKNILHTYLGGDFVEASLAGGTSDYKSWTLKGFAAAFPFENPVAGQYNSALHSPDDTLTTINNLPLSGRFAKMIVGYLAHYAGLNNGDLKSDILTAKKALPEQLFLAVIPDSSEYAVSVSTSEAVKKVLYCRTDSAGSGNCTAVLRGTSEEKSADGRLFWQGVYLEDISEDDRYVFYGYDGDDKVVGIRTVRFAAKTE